MRAAWVLLVSILLALGPMAATADIPKQSGLSMYVSRMVDRAFLDWNVSHWDAYLTISRLAGVLRREDRYGAEIATLTTDTFPEFPRLVLTDQDGDQRADSFAYHDKARAEATLEFGVFFGVGEDPAPMWLVFNSGLVFEDLAAEDLVMFWATHQLVDRNEDGRFDLYIVNGADTDGDGTHKERDTGWVYDDDYDGLVDRAEINAFGEVRALEPEDGAFRIAGAPVREIEVSSPFFAFWDGIAADIRAALGGGEK